MTAPFKTIEGTPDIAGLMHEIGAPGRRPPPACSRWRPRRKRTRRWPRSAEAIRAGASDILAANAEDMAEAKAAGATPAFLDRLALDPKRVAAMADGVEVVRDARRTRSAPSWSAGRGRTA